MQRFTDGEQTEQALHFSVTPQQLRNIADKLERAAQGARPGTPITYEPAVGLRLYYEASVLKVEKDESK